MQVTNSKTARHKAKNAGKGVQVKPKGPKDKQSAKAASKSKASAPVGDVLNTAALAEASGIKATKVRMILRGHENELKDEWRADGGRWVFKTKYEDDIVEFLEKRSDKRKASAPSEKSKK